MGSSLNINFRVVNSAKGLPLFYGLYGCFPFEPSSIQNEREELIRLRKENRTLKLERDILAKFIFPVSVMARVLKVSKSGFYAWLKRPLSQRERNNQILTAKIIEIHKESDSTYGQPRIRVELYLSETPL